MLTLASQLFLNNLISGLEREVYMSTGSTKVGMQLVLSPESLETLFFALNIAENNCAPGNKPKILELQDRILEAKIKWEDSMV